MTQEEALELIRAMLKAPNEQEVTRLISYNLPRFDGTFFSVLNHSIEQLKHEGKPQIAQALEQVGGAILRMRTLI
jgi:ABC-type transporter Mla MlaB component